MNKLFFMLLILTCYFFSFCIGKTNNVSNSTQMFFEYYNLNNLQGVNAMPKTALKYPFVEIEKLKDSTVIVHHLAVDKEFKTAFKNNLATNSFERIYYVEKGMSSFEFHELIKDNTLTTFMYDLSVKKQLAAISFFTGNHLETYAIDVIQENTAREYQIDSAKKYITMLKIYSKQVVDFALSDDSIVLSRGFQNYKLPQLSNFAKHTFTNNKPLYWWLIFKWHFFSDSILFFDEKLVGAE